MEVVAHQMRNLISQTGLFHPFHHWKAHCGKLFAQAAENLQDLVEYLTRSDDEVRTTAVHQRNSGERGTLESTSGEQQRHGMGPLLFCLILLQIKSKFRKKYKPER